jgi:hypothetical protein
MASTTNAEPENTLLFSLSIEYSNTVNVRKNKAFSWS